MNWCYHALILLTCKLTSFRTELQLKFLVVCSCSKEKEHVDFLYSMALVQMIELELALSTHSTAIEANKNMPFS